jgi:hypothetical protein
MLFSVFVNTVPTSKEVNATASYVEEYITGNLYNNNQYNGTETDPSFPNRFVNYQHPNSLDIGYTYTMNIRIVNSGQSYVFATDRSTGWEVKLQTYNGVTSYGNGGFQPDYTTSFSIDGSKYSSARYVQSGGYDMSGYVISFTRHPNAGTIDYNNPYNVWEYFDTNWPFATYSDINPLTNYYTPNFTYQFNLPYNYRAKVNYVKPCGVNNWLAFQLRDGTWEIHTFPKTDVNAMYCWEYYYFDLDGSKYTGEVVNYGDYQGYLGYISLYKRQIKNQPPVLTLTSTDISLLSADAGFSSFSANGFISDPNNGDTEIVTATVAGITKSTTLLNTSVAKPFSIPFDVITDALPNGTYPVTVTVDDQNGGTDTKSFNITIKARAKNNLYILVNDQIYFPPISYSDNESDPQLKIRWKFTHDPYYFENSTGIISDSGVYRSTPYASFPKPGHYTVVVQGEDKPAKYSKWSNDPFTKMNIYVHRRPFAVFSPVVYSNGSGGFIVVPNDASYDLDKQSDATHGISQWQWSWKYTSNSTWTSGQPPQTIPANTNYQMQLKVLDEQGAWSLPVIQAFSTINAQPLPAPTAVMTIPNGTQANPTLVTTTKPTFTWTQSSPAGGMVFKQFEIQVTDTTNSTMIYDSGIKTQNTSSTTQNFAMPSNLPAGQALRVRVKVADSNGTWSNWSAQTWFYINRPPSGNLAFITPIYQNDSPTFTITQSDIDNDALTITVDSSFNGGGFVNIKKWTSVPSGTNKVFTYGPVAVGNYSMRLTLDDGKDGVYNQTYNFTVIPLGLSGFVNHTALWESYRQRWNAMYPENQRAITDFWAGEAFELTSVITNTGTSTTKPTSLTAKLLETDDTISLTSSDDDVNFNGEMLNTNFVHTLTDGSYTMRFTVIWSNGLTQTYDASFNIKGNMYDVLLIQLRN